MLLLLDAVLCLQGWCGLVTRGLDHINFNITGHGCHGQRVRSARKRVLQVVCTLVQNKEQAPHKR